MRKIKPVHIHYTLFDNLIPVFLRFFFLALGPWWFGLTAAVLRLVGLLWATISLAMTILWLVGFRWMLAFPWLLILVPCVGDLLAHLKFSVVDAKWIRRSNYIAFALGVSALKIHLEKLYGKKEKVSAAPDTFFSFSFPFSSLTIFCALFRLNYVVALFFFFFAM